MMVDVLRLARRRGRACVALAIVVVGAGSWGAADGAASRQRQCGHVAGSVAITAVGVKCATARAVGLRYLDRSRGSRGFRCKRYRVDAAAGWYAVCTRGARRVRITPE